MTVGIVNSPFLADVALDEPYECHAQSPPSNRVLEYPHLIPVRAVEDLRELRRSWNGLQPIDEAIAFGGVDFAAAMANTLLLRSVPLFHRRGGLACPRSRWTNRHAHSTSKVFDRRPVAITTRWWSRRKRSMRQHG